MSDKPQLTYLALGDSYTIGESVLLTESFPYQAVAALRKAGIDITAPEIIAKTGWTTDELQQAINGHTFSLRYDFVTLLIGVNNQYRGYPLDRYTTEFDSLLKHAIQFAGGDPTKVAVLSIPDWGATPFAEGRDRQQIAKEIDTYNRVNEEAARQYKVHYINITPGSREAARNVYLVAGDGLHPSAMEYQRWAEQVAACIKSR